MSKLSRGNFIKLSSLTTGFLFFNPLNLVESLLADKKLQHLNLLFPPEDIPELQKRLELPLFKNFWEEMLNVDLKDDRKFLEQGIQFNNQNRHLPRVDDILQREAFIYVMTGDTERGKLARLALQKIFLFEKWDYFLEAKKYVFGIERASYTTQSIVLTYEWISDLLSNEDKEQIFTQLPEKGCEPCYRSLYGMLYPDEVVGWELDPETSFYENWDLHNWPKILSRTNLRALPISALGLGALFLKGKDKRVDRWMDMVKKSYDDLVDLYKKDGSYPEGTSYCKYASERLILFLEILQRQTREDWSNKINWQGVMDFSLMTRMPSNQHPDGHVNFGDGGGGLGSDIGFWVAKKYQDGVAQYAARHHNTKHKICSVIWYDPKIEEKKPQANWFYRHFDIGWVVATTGFEKDDLVVAMRSGGPTNHEHADRNSVILKCYSENLLVDNWHPPYSHTHPAWALRTSPAHNTVLIDGKGHQYHDGMEGTNASLAEAKVVKETKTDYYAIVTSDATQAYQLVNENVKNVNRTLLIMPKEKFIVVVDCLHIKNSIADFKARWFINNEDKKGKIEIYGKNFVFNRPQAKLVGCCEGSHGVKLFKDNFPVPEEHGIYPYLDVTSEKPGKKVVLITAAIALKKQNPMTYPKIVFDGKDWVVNTDIGGREIKVTITMEKLMPKLLVE